MGFLEVKDVSVYYDKVQVLNKISLEVNRGEIVSLIGPNGAGKTTLLRTIVGLVKWQKDSFKGTSFGNIRIEGSVVFDGERIDDFQSYKIVRRGLVLCPERGRPFQEMTIIQNLMVAAYLCKDERVVKENLEKVYFLFPILKERQGQIAGTISGGERTMLAIARGLMVQPKLIMIDEPSTGLSPKIKEVLFRQLKEIHEIGLTIFLVEQDVSYILNITDKNYVISNGYIIAQGAKKELLADDFLRRAYLGL